MVTLKLLSKTKEEMYIHHSLKQGTSKEKTKNYKQSLIANDFEYKVFSHILTPYSVMEVRTQAARTTFIDLLHQMESLSMQMK